MQGDRGVSYAEDLPDRTETQPAAWWEAGL